MASLDVLQRVRPQGAVEIPELFLKGTREVRRGVAEHPIQGCVGPLTVWPLLAFPPALQKPELQSVGCGCSNCSRAEGYVSGWDLHCTLYTHAGAVPPWNCAQPAFQEVSGDAMPSQQNSLQLELFSLADPLWLESKTYDNMITYATHAQNPQACCSSWVPRCQPPPAADI